MMATGSLAQFQDGFVQAIFSTQNPAFLVYRNTVLKGCIDALQANYPAVGRLVGEEWLRAAAAIYARLDPPRVPMLLEYGAGFANFLSHFEPAAELPYLPAVARLDRFWSESHAAADETPLPAQALGGIGPGHLGGMVLRPHAAARWAWFQVPAFTIWSRNRVEAAGSVDLSDIEWRGEGALLTRPHDAVQWIGLDQAGCAFMDACAAGIPLAEAAESVPPEGIAGLLASLLAAGAFTLGEER
jgi:Putative DNA-binding domain